MSDEEQSLYDQIATLKGQRMLMTQLQSTDGWNYLVSVITRDVLNREKGMRGQFLPLTHQGVALDGSQALALSHYSRGVFGGLIRATEIPQAIIDDADDQIKVLEVKLQQEEEERERHDTGSSHDDEPESNPEPVTSPDPDPLGERTDLAP